MYKKKDSYTIENHPFGKSIPKDATTLILGTFPSRPKDRPYEYFYASDSNLFWNVISQVFINNFKHPHGKNAKKEREDFLHSKSIGIYDMIEMCYRKNNSSNDEDIFPIKILDLFEVLDRYPKIVRIILTSRTPVVGTYGLICTYFYQRDKKPFEIYNSEKATKMLKGYFEHKGREIDVYIPQSSSKRNEKNVSEDELIEMYKYCLTT